MKNILFALVASAISFTCYSTANAADLGQSDGEAKSSGFASDSWFDFTDKERWLIRMRAIAIDPDDDASISLIGGTTDIDEQYTPELDISYFFTEHLAAELVLATTRVDVSAVNTRLGDIDLGNVWILPPHLMLQYHFLPESETFRPYLGAGVNYTIFYNADKGGVDDIDYDDSFGFALQAGFDYQIDENWALNFDVKKLFLSTDVTIQSGANTIHADVDIDPWIYGVGLAYRF